MSNVDTEQDIQNAGNCDELRELIPAYGIGAADPEEVAAVQARLDDCPELLAELDDYKNLADTLLYSVPQYEAPASIYDALMKATAPAHPVQAGGHQAPTPTTGSSPRMITLLRQYSPLAAAVALVLLVASNFYWLNTVNDLREENTTLASQITANHNKQLVSLLGGANFSRVELASVQLESPSNGAIAWVTGNTDDSWVAWCVLRELPVLPSDEVYQLWLVRENEPPRSVGMLVMNDEGVASVVFEITEPVGSFDLIWVTIEPAGGSEEPTTPPIIGSEL